MVKTDYFKNMWNDLSKIPVIKTVVAGKEYYFYDFSQAKDDVTMDKYMEAYAKLGMKEEKIVLIFSGICAVLCVVAWFGIRSFI